MNNKLFYVYFGLCLVFLSVNSKIFGQEKIFANYFDIPINSPEGTEVMGRIHLERNKDVSTNPIPVKYHFEIIKNATNNLFKLDTRYDLSNRIMGVLTVAQGKRTSSIQTSYQLIIGLKDGDKLLNKIDIKVNVVKKSLWDIFNERYTPMALNIGRLYGNIKYSDEEIAFKIKELKSNNWQFKEFEKCYQGCPQNYVAKYDSTNDHLPTGTIEYEWQKVADQIGGMGYAYATSKIYGPNGHPEKRKELRETLYQAILAYTNSVPVEGNEVIINGHPIGECTGDGFALLQAHKLAGMQIPTHQWNMTDQLIVPVLYLMPDLLKGMKEQNEICFRVHDALIRYFQIFFSEIKNRRAIDNPKGRWGEIQDTLYSSGAWADANLGHRARTMLALPIIWADYNRPITYVQYWYSDFYKNKPFKNFSFSPGWSPQGVVSDVSRWMTKYTVPAHKYIQSGFQPDGSISHHTDRGTDMVMVAYGFGWLTDCNNGYNYFKNTEFKMKNEPYQFQLDRLLGVYPKLFYKQRMDFLVAGRSFLGDMREFVVQTYLNAVSSMLNAQSGNTQLNGIKALGNICKGLKENTFEYSGSEAFWVNEFLVHRRGENESPFYASLKLKSERTVGAEDFKRNVRRSWYMGYGILQVKVNGDEYSDNILKNFDWHALPGLTEEWRIDPMPLGHAQLSLPGLNKISGVLADGKAGMGIYNHLPKETYSSATALKSYHFIEDKIIALGSNIARLRPGQGNEIVTFIDQTALNSPLTWCVDKEIQTVEPEQSVNLIQEIKDVCWLHQGNKGYVVLPIKKQSLQIKSGKEINVTDRTIADKKPNFIIAVGHGVQPGQTWDNVYRYIQIPNVSAEEMPERVDILLKDLEFTMQEDVAHAVYSDTDKTWQYAFFKPGSISVGKITVTSNDVAQIMLRDNGTEWVLSVNNPMPDGQKQTLIFSTSAKLSAGVYPYKTKGVYPLEGETVTVISGNNGSKVMVELPDSRDATKYNYQSDLYAATPIIVNIPKE